MSEECLKIRAMQLEDEEEVAQLMSLVFTTREPCVSHLGYDPTSFYPMAKLVVQNCLPHQLSFLYEDTSRSPGDRIVGFRLSEPLYVSNEEASEPMSAILFELKRRFIDAHPEIKDGRLNSKKVLHLAAVGIRDGYTGRGLAKNLIKASLEHAKTEGFQLAYVKASTPATQHIFKDLFGFRIVAREKYDSFEYCGQKPFANIPNTEYFLLLERELKDVTN